uniref:Uncharacterized protein n=1 Tax=Arundo donax TaxID=35708 RepID=A0A0A8YDS9_ARUDO
MVPNSDLKVVCLLLPACWRSRKAARLEMMIGDKNSNAEFRYLYSGDSDGA